MRDWSDEVGDGGLSFWVVWVENDERREQGPFETWDATDEWTAELVGRVECCTIESRYAEVEDVWIVDL